MGIMTLLSLPTKKSHCYYSAYKKIQNQSARNKNHYVEMFLMSSPIVPFSNQAHTDQLGQASILERVTELSSEVLGLGFFPY